MKIAIVKLSAIGDIIHAMIVLQFIKQHKPDIDIDWIVEESYKELLEFNPEINKVHTVNLKNANFSNANLSTSSFRLYSSIMLCLKISNWEENNCKFVSLQFMTRFFLHFERLSAAKVLKLI